MKTIARLCLALLPLLAVACGGSASPDVLTSQGLDALNSGDHEAALSKLRKALEGLKPGDDGYLEAKMGAIEARIAGDPDGAQQEFLELASAHPDMVNASGYVTIGGHMANQKAWLPAIAVMDAGIKRFGKDEPKLQQLLEKIQKGSAGDEAATNALKGLGYT